MKNGTYNLKNKLYSKLTFLKKGLVYEYIKYNILGTINFVICHIIYMYLCNNFKIDYKISYTICNVLSALLSYTLNLKITFNQNTFKFTDFVKVYLSHILEYIFNLFLITIFVEVFKVSELISPLIAPIITTPLTFILVRRSIKKRV